MTTDRERWLRLSSLFDRAVDLDAAGRRALLDTECADDPALREELQRMLDADTADSAFDAGAQHVITPSDGDEDTPDEREFDDDRLGVWRIKEQLGRGGMGTVHAAYRDDDTAQRAAIKRLRRRWDGSAQAQRFLQERRILAALSHSNIPRLLDHGLDADGRPWFALEHVDGQPLTTAADTRKLGLRERVVLMLQVCDAVKHAHEHFVVHRDLKPSNILVDGDGHAKVLDFGVAKRIDDDEGQTRTGMVAGFTPEYAAPEQITGGTISAATDVHALGVLLYELLAGRLPHTFDSHDLRAAAEAISTGQAPRLEQAITTGSDADISARLQARRTDVRAFRRYVRGDLGRILQTALAKEPQRRYASVQAFSDDLRRFLDGRPVSVSGDTFGYRARKFVQRNRWGVAMATVAAITMAAGVTGITLKTRDAQAAARLAEQRAEHARTQEARAQSEAKRAKASRDFLTALLGEASPERNNGQDPTVRQILDQASARIDRELADQPELRIETMTTIASAYADLSLYDQAHQLLERAVAIANDTPSIDSGVRATAHARHAYTLLSKGDPGKSHAEAQRAIDLLENAPPGELLAEALSTRATAEYLQEGYAAALASQRESTAMTAATAGKDSKAYGESLVELSYFLSAAGEVEAAVDAARTADELLTRRIPDGKDPAVTRALWAYGAALSSANRDAESIAPLTRALALVGEIYGTESLKAMRSLQLLGGAELAAGRITEARAHLAKAAQLVAAQSPKHPLATLVALDLAEAELRAGDFSTAARSLDALLHTLTEASGTSTRLRKARLLHARTDDALGRHARAKSTLDALLAEAREENLPIGSVLVSLGENARLRGDHAAAAGALEEAATQVAEKSLPITRVELALAKARLAAATGDHKGRDRAATEALALLDEMGAGDAPEAGHARGLVGRSEP